MWTYELRSCWTVFSFPQNKFGSIWKTKCQDPECLGVQHCAKETWRPTLTSEGFQSPTAYVPKPNLRFPKSPASGPSWNCWLQCGWGLNKPGRRERVLMLSLGPGNAPISNSPFNSSLQFLSELWRECLVQTWSLHNKRKVTSNWGEITVFASATEK